MPKTCLPNLPETDAQKSRHAAGPFTTLGLSPGVLQAVDRLGFEEMSPIQAAAIPVIMSGHDVVGQSETGSGKTIAFSIPAIERVDQRSRTTQVIILAPTRELVTQIAEEVRKLAAFTKGLRLASIYGGTAYERQFAELQRGAHIVVATPGRLTDHMARGTLELSGVKMLVLDEADRMLDMGFREDLEKVLAAAPSDRQTVFFSATISPPVQALIDRSSRDARKVTIEKTAAAGRPQVEQVSYQVPHHAKRDVLCRLIDFHDVRSGLIFCNTQRMVEDLTDALVARGYAAERLHGGMAQAQRTRVMDNFKRAAFRFLVATDVAARGIDVIDLELVVNYDLPYDAEDYVHRIGRTGRAGRNGRAVTLVSGAGVHKLRAIERFTAMKIRREEVPSVEAVAARQADVLVERVRTTLASGPFPRESRLVKRLLDEGHGPADVAAAILHHFAPAIPAGPGKNEPGDSRPAPKRGGGPRAWKKAAHPRGSRKRPRKSN